MFVREIYIKVFAFVVANLRVANDRPTGMIIKIHRPKSLFSYCNRNVLFSITRDYEELI